MKLYEFEGHQILSKVGLASPFFVLAAGLDEVKMARRRLKFPIVAKVQVLSGRRGKSGGVKVCTTEKQLLTFAKEYLGQEFPQDGGEEVRFLLLAEKVEIAAEHYISITYDTVKRSPFLLYSPVGGVEIEQLAAQFPDALVRIDFDAQTGPLKRDLENGGVPVDFAQRLWDAIARYDCRLIEVNPLAKTQDGDFVAIDAKVILDDAGLARHRDLAVLPKGAISAIPSKRELEAKKIDEQDYRGSAGSTFIELDGDIAILASGGGASLLVMDSVVAAGGAPANYTEYSGNPPREKVQELTKITLAREGLSGCLVAGAVANFTDIYETLDGFVDGLRETRPKPKYPIVIRRGGPRQKKAYAMLEKVAKRESFDIHLFGPETPISAACKKMVELSNEFKNENLKLKGKN